ncbi:WYL domain-containing protein [Streptomyces griseorubiginosus]|uniref:WYL domain-containing protein n=1 Tax=Streptomyces griseorubiginosus TaxID=67304 RepID=UPI0036E5A300
MRHTKNETTTQTLTRLITALDKQQPVTITYTKSDGSVTIRTIEIFNVIVSNAGDILVRAMDRETGEMRSFRIDRIEAYTVHRTAYVIERPAADTRESRTVGLATVTVLYPIDLPITARIDLLADALAA